MSGVGGVASLPASPLSPSARRWVLAAAFCSWLGAGGQMGLVTLSARPAADGLLPAASSTDAAARAAREGAVGQRFAAQLAALQLGAAVGGVVFGRLADGRGRARALGLSVICYACGSGAASLATSVEALVGLRFLTGLGIGGAWPAAVALSCEAWPGAAKAKVAGIVGSAANVGILIQALVSGRLTIDAESWRWASLVGAAPVVLGALVWWLLPESPGWLADRAAGRTTPQPAAPLRELFRPALLRNTLVGIALATVPLLGAWGSGKWLIPWAGASSATTQAVWAVGAVLASALGGWLADQCGRRTTYFVVSGLTLAINLAIFRLLEPTDAWFLPAVFCSGLVGTVFFGWLPLYLPELFPTGVRATGIGLTYNAGRIATACGILAAGELMRRFEGDYARVGEWTSWVYALGMVVILAAPRIDRASAAPRSTGDTSANQPAAPLPRP